MKDKLVQLLDSLNPRIAANVCYIAVQYTRKGEADADTFVSMVSRINKWTGQMVAAAKDLWKNCTIDELYDLQIKYTDLCRQ